MIRLYDHVLKTPKKFKIIDITDVVNKDILDSKIKSGIAIISTMHTTTAIRVNEKEPLLFIDIEEYLKKLTQSSKDYLHDDIKRRKNCPDNEPKNAESHLQSLLMGATESLPIKDSKLILGKWQHIFFIELDGPRERSYNVTIIGE
jgi:secondary thiamine-phosphate synthase enzyme